MSHTGATTSPTVGDVGRYATGRRRVLGRIPTGDPALDVELIAQALGGRALASKYVAQMVREIHDAGLFDHEGHPLDFAALYGGAGL